MIETLAYGYSSESTQWETSHEYQHNRVKMVFKNLCIVVFGTKVASELGESVSWKPDPHITKYRHQSRVLLNQTMKWECSWCQKDVNWQKLQEKGVSQCNKNGKLKK